VDLSLILPRSLRIPVLLSGLAFVFALGCNGPSVPVPVDINMEATSCVDGALSMSFDIVASNSLFPATYQYGSSNVIPVPSISGSATSFHVVAGLDTVAAGDAVAMTFSSSAFPNTTTSIQNIQFYTVPVTQVGPPACPPEHGPVIGTSDGPGIGIHLEISNSSPDPLVIDQLEMAEVTDLIPPSGFYRGSKYIDYPIWIPPTTLPPGTVLAPGSPPLIVDLPETPAAGTAGVLLRYITHSSSGVESSAMMQVDLSFLPVATKATTWGKVKSLYR